MNPNPMIMATEELIPTLKIQAASFERQTGIPCRLEENVGGLAIDRQRSRGIARIFQATLSSVIRDSGASAVEANVRRENRTLILIIQNNGRGLIERKLTSVQSLGVQQLYQLADLVGGELDIHDVPENGTKFMLRVPLTPN